MALAPLSGSAQTTYNANDTAISVAMLSSGPPPLPSLLWASFDGITPQQWCVDSTQLAAVEAFIANDANWLTAAKSVKLDALNAKYDSIIAAGRIITGKTFPLGDSALFAMQMFWNNNNWPISWIFSDNSTLSLNMNEFHTKAQSVLQYIRALWANRLAKKLAILAAANLTQLNAVNLNIGWPSNP